MKIIDRISDLLENVERCNRGEFFFSYRDIEQELRDILLTLTTEGSKSAIENHE